MKTEKQIKKIIKQLYKKLKDKGIPELPQSNICGMIDAYEDVLK